MNKITISGRLVRDIEIKDNNTTIIGKFTIAVNRNKDTTDFIDCVAFDKVASSIQKYCTKGTYMIAAGRLEIKEYTRNDIKKRIAEVVCDNVEFVNTVPMKKNLDEESSEEVPF